MLNCFWKSSIFYHSHTHKQRQRKISIPNWWRDAKASALVAGKTLSELKLLCNHCQSWFSSARHIHTAKEISNFQLKWLRISSLSASFSWLANSTKYCSEPMQTEIMLKSISTSNWSCTSTKLYQKKRNENSCQSVSVFTWQCKKSKKQNARCHLSHL